MYFIGLLLVAFALFRNLKAYPNVFAGKKKRAEAQAKFDEAWGKMDETGFGKNFTKGAMNASLIMSTFFSFLFYLITSVVINNPIMYALAVAIFLLNIIINKNGMKAIAERKLTYSKSNKIALPLKTAYIVGFFILFFL